MKKEFSKKPETFNQQWLTASGGFSWYDFVLGMPVLVFVVTGWKPNGKENASLHSWATFVGAGTENFICLLGRVGTGGHMYQSLKETGVCVLNFPSNDIYDKCIKTIGNNQYETDEITASGLTMEKATKVNAPRISECFLNIECEYLWERELIEGCGDMTVALKAVNMSMDEERYDQAKLGRYGKTGYLYNIDQPTHPVTGETSHFGPGIIVQGDTVEWVTR